MTYYQVTYPVAGWIGVILGVMMVWKGIWRSLLIKVQEDEVDEQMTPLEQKETQSIGSVSETDDVLKQDKIIVENVDTSDQHFYLALTSEDAGSYDKAIAEYTKSIELDNNYSLAYFNRALLLMKLRRNTEAVADFEKVIKKSDNSELVEMAKSSIRDLKA